MNSLSRCFYATLLTRAAILGPCWDVFAMVLYARVVVCTKTRSSICKKHLLVPSSFRVSSWLSRTSHIPPHGRILPMLSWPQWPFPNVFAVCIGYPSEVESSCELFVRTYLLRDRGGERCNRGSALGQSRQHVTCARIGCVHNPVPTFACEPSLVRLFFRTSTLLSWK